MELLQDHEFNSPSQAASIVLARIENGHTFWKDPQGTTLGENLNQTA